MGPQDGAERQKIIEREPGSGVFKEMITPGWGPTIQEFFPIEIRSYVSQTCGARGLSTGTALFPQLARLAYHVHPCAEAVTVLEGEAIIAVEGRMYSLLRLDSAFIPAGIAHSVWNPSALHRMLVHSAFSSASPSRTLVVSDFAGQEAFRDLPRCGEPELIQRFSGAARYELAAGTAFYDLFAKRFGASGICGGYGEFAPGASLPCHVHQFDESITIITGRAVCMVAGRSYNLSDCDTAFVPEGHPHRFINHSDDVMGMIWVYAGEEPERTVVEVGYCDGTLAWADPPIALLRN